MSNSAGHRCYAAVQGHSEIDQELLSASLCMRRQLRVCDGSDLGGVRGSAGSLDLPRCLASVVAARFELSRESGFEPLEETANKRRVSAKLQWIALGAVFCCRLKRLKIERSSRNPHEPLRR